MFKVAIVRDENFVSYNDFQYKCAKFLQNKVKAEKIMVNTTGDAFVEKFCSKFGIDMQFFYTDWKKHGKMALKQRSEEMLKNSDALIAFNGKSKDIDFIIKLAEGKNLPKRVVSI